MQINGYEIYVARSSYVDKRMLVNPTLRSSLEKKIGDILASPTAHRFTQAGELTGYRRARIRDNWRVYLRLHDKFNVAVIVAFDNASDTKRNELAGSLDFHFTRQLLTHRHLDITTLTPLGEFVVEQKKETIPLSTEDTFLKVKPHVLVNTEEVSRDRMLALLGQATQVRWGLFDGLMEKLRGATDRLIYDPLAEGTVGDVEGVKALRVRLAQFLKKQGLPWGVRFDDISQKLIVFPDSQRNMFADYRRGRRSVGGDGAEKDWRLDYIS